MWFKHNRMWLGKISLLLVMLLVSGVGVLGCAPTGDQPKGWSGGTIADGTLYIGSMGGKLVAVSTSDGSRLWAEPLKAPESSGGLFGRASASRVVAIYGSPAVAGDLVYVGGYNGKIYTISISTRLSKDKYLNEKDRKPIIGGPLVAGGTVYIGSSDGLVYALDAISLLDKWAKPFETGDEIWSTPAISGDTLFIGSFDKKLYAIDTTTGKGKWEKPFETGGAIVSTPVVYNSTVYIGSFDRYLYAISASDGTLKWKFPATGEDVKPQKGFWAKPVIRGGVVYAANLDGKVYALDAQSGNKLDEFTLGSPKNPISASPVLVGNSVIVATEDGVVYAIDIASNEKKPLVNLKEKIYAPLSASEGIIYIHTEKDALYAVEAQTGAKREFSIK